MLITANAELVEAVTLPSDKTEPKTEFFVGAIRSELFAKILDLTNGENAESVQIYTRNFQFVKFGVKGWRDLINAKGEDVPFDEKKYIEVVNYPGLGNVRALTTAALELLKPHTMQIGIEVFRKNFIAPEQEKNSESPSK